MQQSDRPAFAQLITDVLAYYRQDASRFVLDLWWNACQGFELEQIRTAVQRHCTDPERGQFAPKVADIARVLMGTSTERAALAWGKVQEAMGAVGGWQDVVFDDPAIHAVIEDLGGWPKVCSTLLKEMSYLQHRFQEAYRAYVAAGQFEYPRRLAGARDADWEYTSRGLPAPRPVFVGDRQRALLVLQNGSASGKTQISSVGREVLAALAAPAKKETWA
ncbi:DUF6475 domain-containing protein [Comamonas sp. w2-DMI]|uniref:DUF6475 domain-containing protein n=1 Tax=Comamonas sp. w2-DMI TaxID=3126391 RepID=UPI0032E46F61